MDPSTITVIGAGTMGHGIAQVSALAGFETRLYDLDSDALSRARDAISRSLIKGIEKGKLTEDQREQALARLTSSSELDRCLSNTHLVIEAIVEDLDVKRRVFEDVESRVSESTILASNTSSLSLAKIADATTRPQNVIGMHFFNPVPVMKLIEVVVHERTSEATRDRALEVGRRFGKEPITVTDSPGFASSRLGVVIGLEAMRMVEQGVASAEDIDKAMELGYRHPMGPLKLTDLVGLDVRLAIAETLHRELGDPHYRPPDILRQKVDAGELGKKSGRGFYEWPSS